MNEKNILIKLAKVFGNQQKILTKLAEDEDQYIPTNEEVNVGRMHTIIPDPSLNTIQGLRTKRNQLKEQLIHDMSELLSYYGVDDDAAIRERINNALSALGVNKP